MNAPSTIQEFTDAAADAVGREIARLRAEAKREGELRDAEYRARTAELETRIMSAANLERDLRERLETLKDGEPGADGKDGIDGEPGKDGADGRDGHDVEDIDVTQADDIVVFGFTVGDARMEFETRLPAGPPGVDGEPGKDGPAGKLEAVEPWSDQVHYEGSIRTHGGATYQALKDTAKEPPSEDWVCIAERGADGRSLSLAGTWDDKTEYRELEIVTLNGGSFAARKDNPGECPGPDWKLLASQGKTGKPGERGRPGDRGPPGPPVKSLTVDPEGLLTLENADGSTVTCDLYPVLAKLDR